jgi:hypothetical protein
MMSQNFEIPARPTAAERKLDVFLGRWRTTGTTEAGDGMPGGEIDVSDNYEWLPGEVLMVHAWVGDIGGQPNKGLEIYTHDPAKGRFFSHFFGSPNVGRVYEMTVDAAGVWTVTGPSERGRYVFEDMNTFTGIWERSDDGIHWAPLCEFRSTRVD